MAYMAECPGRFYTHGAEHRWRSVAFSGVTGVHVRSEKHLPARTGVERCTRRIGTRCNQAGAKAPAVPTKSWVLLGVSSFQASLAFRRHGY